MLSKRDKARRIAYLLNELYPNPSIPLHHSDPFTLLIAVVLSAQCTDARVNIITPSLFARACTPQEMACMDPKEIESLIRSCGLASTKARNLQKLSALLVERHEGKVPCSYEELEALPGVGHKTASVLMAQAFSIPAFPVDTHIHRCAKRWGLSEGRTVEKTEADLKKLFPKKLWSLLHLQIIYFAREYCPAMRHDGTLCPICSWASEQKL